MAPVSKWRDTVLSGVRWASARGNVVALIVALVVNVISLVVGLGVGRSEPTSPSNAARLESDTRSTNGALPSSPPSGRELELDRLDGLWELGEHAEMLVDPEERLTLSEARAATDWRPVGAARRTLQLARGVLWLRVTVRDALGADRPIDPGPGWRVAFAHPRPIRLTAWVPDGDHIAQKRAGLATPLDEREVVARSVIVPFSLSAGATCTLYFRLDTAPLGFSALIGSSSSMARHDVREERVLGAYYGAAAALFLYNLFLFVVLREMAYGWYLVVVAATVQFFLSRNGYFFLFGWTAGTGSGGGVLVAIQMVGIANFTRTLLGTRDVWPRGDRLLGAMVVGCVAIGAAALIVPSRLHEAVIAPFGMVIVLGSLVAGVLRWREGSRVARYFVTAWGFFLAGAVIYFVKSTGLLPHTPTTEHAMQVGSALEMVLLSLALADRIRTVELDARQKEHRLALARAEHASAVEALRADAARRMIEAQDEHTRRLARDLHDSVGHRFLLIEYAAADTDTDDDEVRSAIVALAREGAVDTREIAHGLYPQRLLDVGLTGALQSAADVVTRAGLGLDFDVDERATTRLGEAQRLAVLRVAEEAFQNALRHADASRIAVALKMKTGAVVLEVLDNGAGIALAASDGLGMRTMRERAAHVGAHLVVEPSAPRGTVVRMVMPVA